MTLLEKIRSKAREVKKKIVLPEGEEERTIKAGRIITDEKIASVILLGSKENITSKAKSLNINISDIPVIEPEFAENFEDFSKEYYEIRKSKGMTLEQAREIMKNTLYYGAIMVRRGLTDGSVAGAINTTGDVLRAGIQIIGLAEGINVVSSIFLMILPDGKALTYGDCAVVPDPTPEQLASIAIASAESHKSLTGEEPIVAMLSFSTKGSAEHPLVEKVVKATGITKKLKPDLKIDGEMQFDAAYVPEIGKRKAPGSEVAGKANVFIFPNLDAGNISYKITQRLAKAEAIGPIIQGLKKPANDLSRGCNVEDIVNVAAICAVRSL
jgi:phosphate acetyltransferase